MSVFRLIPKMLFIHGITKRGFGHFLVGLIPTNIPNPLHRRTLYQIRSPKPTLLLRNSLSVPTVPVRTCMLIPRRAATSKTGNDNVLSRTPTPNSNYPLFTFTFSLHPIGGVRLVGLMFLCYTIEYEN
jgi:hypothetical protein